MLHKVVLFQRKLANTQLEDNLINRDVIVYLIAEGSSKDFGLKSNSIYIGDGSHSGYLSYDPFYGLTIKANRIEMVSGGTIGGDTASKEDLTKLRNDMNSFKSDLTTQFLQTKNEINLSVTQSVSNYVKKNEVVAQINLSSEGVRIAGSKIQIDGNTIFNNDTKFNGIIEAGKSIIIENTGAGKRTILKGGTIEFYEWSP